VYDHLVRLYDITESLRDLVVSALDTYLSAVNTRMNEVMKTLTVITTLFMPLSFLSGFFWMNFFQPITPLDVWTNKPVFGLVLAAMILIPVGMHLWMRKRAWMQRVRAVASLFRPGPGPYQYRASRNRSPSRRAPSANSSRDTSVKARRQDCSPPPPA
jgi:hypothetical protein